MLRLSVAKAKKLAVIDRNIGFGVGGIFAQEVRAALHNHIQIPVFGFVAGLGGRDVRPSLIREVIEYTETHDEPEDLIWKGLKP
jgi:pyruvate/2-oxoacid:ferredoxin oxidoreductase alpha subunit